jgi:glutathione S-transferase
MDSKTWAIGDDFTLADCAAAPALFYANTVVPLAETHTNLAAYLDRLMQRPSFARVLEEAQPYFKLFPMEKKLTIARLGRVASR